MDYETHSDFFKLLYKLLSFKCKLETREIEILIWRFYNKLSFKEIGLLLGISSKKANNIYLYLLHKIRGEV